MYNEKIKENFIAKREETVTVSIKQLRCFFNNTERFESMIDKDISNFSTEEIIDFYKASNYSSMESLANFNSAMSVYTSYCIENGIVNDGQNHFKEMTTDVFAECINQSIVRQQIVTKEILQENLHKLQNPRDRFIILCLFEFGRSYQYSDILRARIEDIDTEKKTMKLYSGRTVKVSSKLILTAFMSRDAEYKYGKIRRVVLYDDGTIIKRTGQVTTTFQSGRILYDAFRKAIQEMDLNPLITPNTMAISGQISMVKTEAAKLGITPKEYLDNYKEDINQQYGIRIIKNTFLLKYGDYL